MFVNSEVETGTKPSAFMSMLPLAQFSSIKHKYQDKKPTDHTVKTRLGYYLYL